MSLERWILRRRKVVECSGVQAASWCAVERRNAYPVIAVTGGSYNGSKDWLEHRFFTSHVKSVRSEYRKCEQ